MKSALVLSCEHASAEVPEGVDLGVSDLVRLSHVGWDHGALEIARILEARWQAPLEVGRYTRLFVDLNRSEENPAIVPCKAFGADVPANSLLEEVVRLARIADHHRPYRQSVLRHVRAAVEIHGRCLHLPIHSFTPEMHGCPRPYEMGILFDPDRPLEARVAEILLQGLRDAGIDARANEPYCGTDDGIATAFRLLFPEPAYACVEIETSHCVTEVPGGIQRVAEALAGLEQRILQA